MRILPLNERSKTAFNERLNKNGEVKIRKRKGNKVLVSSETCSFLAWIDLSNDPNWLLIL